MNNNSSDNIENENKDFLNNISEELKAEMRMIQSYNNIGKMVGSFYLGLLDNIDADLAIEFTEAFISGYIYNLFNSFGGERK